MQKCLLWPFVCVGGRKEPLCGERGKGEGAHVLVCACVHLCVPTCMCMCVLCHCVCMYPHMLDATSLEFLSFVLFAQTT